jgi:hypothetical protein
MLDSAARPLLHLEGARVALPDGSELGPWTANATGQRLALVGNFHGWFRLLERQNRLVQGVAEVAGTRIELILSSGRAGFAPLDPPLPEKWTLRRYLTESAALSPIRRAKPADVAQQLLARFSLETLAERKLLGFNRVERRTVAVVRACANDPEVLICEAPLANLDDASHDYLEGLIERVFEGRRSIVSVVDPGGRERGLLERASSVLEVGTDPHRVAERAKRAPARLWVTVTRRADEFRAALRGRAHGVEPMGDVGLIASLLGDPAGVTAQRFAVELHGGGTADILAAAEETGASVVEIREAP